jgi:DNA modification methylase
VFREVRRVLRDDGVLWVNLGDSYANDGKWGGSSGGKHVAALHGNSNVGRGKKFTGLKPKDIIGIPWMVAFALRADGWYLRSDIIWAKPNPMPESVRDRPTKAHEYIFLLSKSQRYFYDADAIAEKATFAGKTVKTNGADGMNNFGDGMRTRDGLKRGVVVGDTRNKRSVWSVSSQPFPGAHFATFPPELIEPCILAGCPEGGTVLDPFGGSGTTGAVALRLGRRAALIELNPAYCEMARERMDVETNAPDMFAAITRCDKL